MTKKERDAVAKSWAQLNVALGVFGTADEEGYVDFDLPREEFPNGLRFALNKVRDVFGTLERLLKDTRAVD